MPTCNPLSFLFLFLAWFDRDRRKTQLQGTHQDVDGDDHIQSNASPPLERSHQSFPLG
ncbi:unnamed protein product [Musa acuminata subsp. burmannicoides]